MPISHLTGRRVRSTIARSFQHRGRSIDKFNSPQDDLPFFLQSAQFLLPSCLTRSLNVLAFLSVVALSVVSVIAMVQQRDLDNKPNR